MPRIVILLCPSRAACVELPRRIASGGIALAGVRPFTLADLARAIAEPILLSRGVGPWLPAHAAELAESLLDASNPFVVPGELPRAPVALALARAMDGLRCAGLDADRLRAVLPTLGATGEDRDRLRGVADAYARYCAAFEGRFADRTAVYRTASAHLDHTPWLRAAELVVVSDLSLEPVELSFLAALARATRVRRIESVAPARLATRAFGSWCAAHGISAVGPDDTPLAPLDRSFGALPPGLARLRTRLFEPSGGAPAGDASVELLTAPGEAAEARALVRRLLREAKRGVAFDEMAVLLPRAEIYVPLLTDLLTRLSVPYRLHPSLPLRTGRVAGSLLLLLACRGLPRAAVMEFLTFAPIPFDRLLGEGRTVDPAVWDAISREAGVVSGLERWIIGLRSFAEDARGRAAAAPGDARRAAGSRRAEEAEALLRVVELMSATLDGLAGEASWPEWSVRLLEVLDQWIGPHGEPEEAQERDAVAGAVTELSALAKVAGRVSWERVEHVLANRLDWERMPLAPVPSGAVHLGSLDALAGIPFRVVAIPGLVEGGYPGVFRQDPFLLDDERAALSAALAPPGTSAHGGRLRPRQLSLFEETPADVPNHPATESDEARLLPTTHARLIEERRAFHRAVCQAREHLILSYPRADSRTGRERLPSLFFVAAATAREGRMLSTPELDGLVHEDTLDSIPLDEALDAGERDRARLVRDAAAAPSIAAGSHFFSQARRAMRGRWSRKLTAFDGFLGDLPEALSSRLDPTRLPRPLSASRLATYARCGFQYLLRYVLHLEPLPEPMERFRLDSKERGSLFHAVAESFLRERRDAGELPLRDTPALRARLRAVGAATLAALVAPSPPRYAALWTMESERFQATLAAWLERETRAGGRATPAHFEVAFGSSETPTTAEPHLADPIVIAIDAERMLRIAGRIDRIDVRPDGSLVLRDYKTGRVPTASGAALRSGVELQIPIYAVAAARMFPDRRVAQAFLDYVDGGRSVPVEIPPDGEARLGRLLRGLAQAMADGLFLQDPDACQQCDFTAVCGPRALIERRRQQKLTDPRLRRRLSVWGAA